MLTSPTTITIDGVAHQLSRINQDNYSAVYLKKAAGLELRLTIRHSYEGKEGPGQFERHNVDLVHTVWDENGIATVRQTYHVIRNPRHVDPDGVADDTVGLNTWLATNIAAICGWES
jgi:3-phenylpropionate/cinnamic acid dioxygenase small subunit